MVASYVYELRQISKMHPIIHRRDAEGVEITQRLLLLDMCKGSIVQYDAALLRKPSILLCVPLRPLRLCGE